MSLVTTKILDIVNSQDFYYYACNGCHQKVYCNKSQGFTCYKCGSDNVVTTSKYRLKFTIVYRSNIAVVTAFDKLLERYFGCKAGDLVRFLEYLFKMTGDNVAVKATLNSAMAKVFVGQLFTFQFGPQSACRFNSPIIGTSQVKKSLLTVKHMFTTNMNATFATVFYCFLFELLGSHENNPNDGFLSKTKHEAEIMKEEADAINKKILQKEQYKRLTQHLRNASIYHQANPSRNSPNVDTSHFKLESNILMNESLIQYFLEDSFSFFNKAKKDNDDLKVAEHKCYNVNQTPIPANVTSNDNVYKHWCQGAEDSMLLQMSKTPKPANNMDVGSFRAEESFDASFFGKKETNSPSMYPNIYFTSTPACGQQTKKRRISLDHMLPSYSCNDKSLSDIFVNDSAESQDSALSTEL